MIEGVESPDPTDPTDGLSTAPRPTVIGRRYALGELLGQGGMAEVYRAFDRVLSRDVAVKLIHTRLATGTDRERFAVETRLLARLNDPHLVTILDAGVEEEPGRASRPWLVMELVPGPTLARRLADGPLPAADAAAVAADVAHGLAHAHSLDVIHRDVKPANVLLTRDGGAKLADFGVARSTGEDHGLTLTGHTVGTAAYLAPEQVTGEPVSSASDVYALGLMVLEARTGRPAYVGTGAEVAFARLHHSPLVPTSLGAPWVRLLTEMTATEPTQRPTAAQAATRFDDLRRRSEPTADLTTDGPGATRMLPGLGVDEAGTGWFTGRRLAAVLLAAVVALGFVAWAVHDALAGDPGPASSATTAATMPTDTPSPSRSARTSGIAKPTAPRSGTPSIRPVVSSPARPQTTTPHHRVRHHEARHHEARHHKPHHQHRKPPKHGHPPHGKGPGKH